MADHGWDRDNNSDDSGRTIPSTDTISGITVTINTRYTETKITLFNFIFSYSIFWIFQASVFTFGSLYGHCIKTFKIRYLKSIGVNFLKIQCKANT